MSSRNGSITIEIEGAKRTFTFGLNCWHEFCLLQKISLSKISEALSSDSPGFLGAVRDLVYSAALADCEIKGIEADFNRFQVGQWVNDMPQKDFDAIMNCMFESKLLGNQLGLAGKAVEAVVKTQPQLKKQTTDGLS